MVYTVLHTLSVVCGLALMSLTRDNFARVIIVLQAVAIGAALLGYFVPIAMILFVLTILLIVIYAFVRVRQRSKRAVILLIAVPNLVVLVYAMNHWPGAGIFAMIMTIPILAYAIGVLRNWTAYKSEVGFLTILFLSTVSTLIRTVEGIMSSPE
jgi:hypothetical membrane protein